MRLGVVLSFVVTALVPPRPHHLAVLLLDRIEALPTAATTEQAFTQELNPIRDQVQVAIQDVADADAPEELESASAGSSGAFSRWARSAGRSSVSRPARPPSGSLRRQRPAELDGASTAP